MLPGPTTGFVMVADAHPELWQSFEDLVETTWSSDALPPDTLELCRRRIAQLLGADPDLPRPTTAGRAEPRPSQADALADWPASPAFDAVQRACLAVAEQMVLDVQAIDAASASPVLALVGPRGWTTLVVGCGLAEAMVRGGAVLGEGGQTATAG